MRTWIWIAAMLLACKANAAEDGMTELETITVTGSRISYRDLLETPAIALRKPGDFLLTEITLINDTRDAKSRESEIYQTIKAMLARAGTRFQLVYGDAYASVLSDANYQVPLQKDERRADVSKLTLSVRTALAADGNNAAQLTRELRAFIDASKRFGRSEIEVGAEPALSMRKPERFRYELIAAIADDTRQLQRTMGPGCKITIDGLNSRIEWERASVSELLLYIPYTVSLSDCRAP